MKKYIIVSILCLMIGQAYSQETQEKKIPGNKFSTGVAIYTDLWQGVPDNISPRFINQGTEASVMYNIPVERSPLIFAIGAGIGTHNLYSNGMLRLDSNNVYQFFRVDNIVKDTSGNTYNYKKSKFSVTYMDFPFEFRYNAKKGFRMSVGMKFGFVVSSLTKYKGDDLGGSGNSLKTKEKDIKNLEKWRYGFTASVGYKWLEFYGYYSLINVFKSEKGPEIYPVSIGLNLRPLFLN